MSVDGLATCVSSRGRLLESESSEDCRLFRDGVSFLGTSSSSGTTTAEAIILSSNEADSHGVEQDDVL